MKCFIGKDFEPITIRVDKYITYTKRVTLPYLVAIKIKLWKSTLIKTIQYKTLIINYFTT
ncbi:hypothetical protein KUL42_25000 [Alteromonas sp. KUL42]|nr:hypothetical protein KUL42_25000 [Alteromonas sp. KUL42]